MGDVPGETPPVPEALLPPVHEYRTRRQCPNINTLVDMSNFHHVDVLEEIVQEMEEATWERSAPTAKCFLCTRSPGPPWNLVYRRVTYDLDTEEVIQDVLIADITNKQRTGLLPKDHENGTRTVFYYRRPKGSEETVG
eukprot:6491595-Amphidinium_carterae.2